MRLVEIEKSQFSCIFVLDKKNMYYFESALQSNFFRSHKNTPFEVWSFSTVYIESTAVGPPKMLRLGVYPSHGGLEPLELKRRGEDVAWVASSTTGSN